LSTLNLGGEAITVLASGFLDPSMNSNGPAFGLYAATAAGGPLVALPSADIPMARVQAIHNSADMAAEKVDVWLNDMVLVDDFEFRTATPFVDAQARVPFTISIADSNSTDTVGALAQYTYTLMEDSMYIMVASGIVSNSGYSPATPFSLEVFGMARDTSSNSSTTDVLVYHGSTDAPTVDIYESSIPAGTLVDDIMYSDFAGYLSLNTADYEIQVRNENNSMIVAAYQAPLNTLNLGGEAITVLASGFLDPTINSNGPAFGLYAATAAGGPLVALPSADIPTAKVQAIHNSADLAVAKVDVWLNDMVLADDFEFRTATPFVDAQAGVPFTISIADSNSTDTAGALAQYTYTLMEDSMYIMVASGIVSSSGYSPATPFSLEVFGRARDTSGSSSTTDVLVYHGSTDAPAVDVREISIPVGLLVDSISYSEYAGYLSLNTADYRLSVEDAGNNNTIAVFNAPLNSLNLGGEAITVLASGFANPANNSNRPAFGLYVALPAGGALLPLTNTTSISEISRTKDFKVNIYPNPNTGWFNLETTGYGTAEQIQVMDIRGQLIEEIRLSNSQIQRIDISNLSKGTYVLQIIGDSGMSIERVVVR
jgi:hypothetical protein